MSAASSRQTLIWLIILPPIFLTDKFFNYFLLKLKKENILSESMTPAVSCSISLSFRYSEHPFFSVNSAEHKTAVFVETGISFMIFFGHTPIHFPHPLQREFT